MSKFKTHAEIPADVERVASVTETAAATKPATVQTFKEWTPIELKLPDGRVLVMQEPRLLSRLQNQIMKDVYLEDPRLLTAELTIVQALLFIHSIDGVVVSKPQDGIERDALEQKIGIRNMGLVVRAFRENFPDFDAEAYQVIKK